MILLVLLISIIGLVWLLFLQAWIPALIYIALCCLPIGSILKNIGALYTMPVIEKAPLSIIGFMYIMPTYMFLIGLYVCVFVNLEAWVRYPCILLIGAFMLSLGDGIYQLLKKEAYNNGGYSPLQYLALLPPYAQAAISPYLGLAFWTPIVTIVALIVNIVLHVR